MLKPKKDNFIALNKHRKKKLAKQNNKDIRTKILDIHPGSRTIQIASMNVDALRANDAIYSTIDNISRNKIDIACIQETHNERTDSIKINEYHIFFGGSDTLTNSNNNISHPGGTAIIIRQTLIQHIQKVIRINGRIMEIRLKTGLKNQTLSILNTYAPHMGYQNEQINAYWATLNQYIDAIPNTYIRIWCTDNNGQISKPSNSNNNIGPWTLTNKTDKGNGGKLITTCTKHDYICANAHRIPKTITKRILPHGTAQHKQTPGKSTSSLFPGNIETG